MAKESSIDNLRVSGQLLTEGFTHAHQDDTTGAQPPIQLTQADVDQDMMELTCGTIAAGNAIEAIGAKTLTTTHFIKVTITGVGALYIPCGTIA